MANKNLVATEQAAARIELAAERLTKALLAVEARMISAAEMLHKAEAMTQDTTKPKPN